MDAVNTSLLLGALLLFISVAASVASSRFGFPLLLVFLVVGMLAGEDGPGGMQFSDFGLSFLIGNLALALGFKWQYVLLFGAIVGRPTLRRCSRCCGTAACT